MADGRKSARDWNKAGTSLSKTPLKNKPEYNYSGTQLQTLPSPVISRATRRPITALTRDKTPTK
jgi:hypothetical protein